MFSSHGQPSSFLTDSDTTFSSDNFYIPTITTTPSTCLRQLVARDLDEISSTDFIHQRPMQRESFRIPRPMLTITCPKIDVPTNDSLWIPYASPMRGQQSSISSSSPLVSRHSEQPLYQNLPLRPSLPLPPLPPLPPIPNHYQVDSPPIYRLAPIPVTRPVKQRKCTHEKPSGLFTTLSAGGLYTLAGLIYLSFLVALPVTKLVLGILYVKECPVNKNIPLYMIISGACGLAIVILLLLSSACTFCRSMSNANNLAHRLTICTIALARGVQGAIAIFLFIWFLFGNVWVFNAQYRVRTDRPNDTNNYCHPVLYWFAFYVLIFTYVYAVFTCCVKFCVNFFCCGACDTWYKAFS